MLSDRLKQAMERVGMSQAELARACDVKPPSIHGWLNNKSKFLRGENLLKAAKALKVREQWLADGEPPMLPPNFEPRTYTAAAIEAAEKAIFTLDTSNVDEVGRPARLVRTPVVGTARMGEDGYYEEIDYPVGHGDGHVDSYSSDPNVYALRVKGDSMHPAIRHGSFVVVEPNGRCVPGEYIVLALRDGQKMVKELVIERPHEIVIESVNGNHRKTIDRTDIEKMHPVAAIDGSCQSCHAISHKQPFMPRTTVFFTSTGLCGEIFSHKISYSY